jgi:hypothetical protein
MAKKLTAFVIAYDFDGTLAPGNMQEYDYVPSLGIKPKDFWEEAKDIAKKQEADEILAYMRLMIEKSEAAKIPIRKDDFINFGKSILLFPGVKDWFKRINAYGKSKKVNVEHFIISSGLREMIEGTPIASCFKKIYASGFMFDHNGVAHWPALAVNYTTKTQYLFRINKNSLDVHDNSMINKYIQKDHRPVPFSNILFIGDGETDIPSMRLVKDQGGHSIAVYPKNKKGARDKAQQLIKDGRVTIATLADYTEGAALDVSVKAMIDKIAANRTITDSSG